jgi:hypothetical protein
MICLRIEKRATRRKIHGNGETHCVNATRSTFQQMEGDDLGRWQPFPTSGRSSSAGCASAQAEISDGKAELISRRANTYQSCAPMREQLGREFGGHRAVLDGELVVLDAKGRPQFYDLLRRRRMPVLAAFDLLYLEVRTCANCRSSNASADSANSSRCTRALRRGVRTRSRGHRRGARARAVLGEIRVPGSLC